MNISLHDVEYFAAVASHQNVTRAAKALGVTQPSLSAAIRRVESAVGAHLFLRSKSGVRLTKAGTLFQARAREFLACWQGLGMDVRERERNASAKYFLGCHASLGLYTLPSCLPGLLGQYPLMELELVHASSREITQGVVDFRLDFGIVADPAPHPDLVIRTLGNDEVCFVTGEKTKATAGPKELGHSVLICDPGIYQTQFLLKKLAARGIAFRRHLHTSRLDLIAALADSGAGIGILPLRTTERIRTGRLTPIPWLPKMKNTICLIYRRDSQASEAGRKMARYMEAQLRWVN